VKPSFEGLMLYYPASQLENAKRLLGAFYAAHIRIGILPIEQSAPDRAIGP